MPVLILCCLGCTALKNRRRKAKAEKLGIPYEHVKFDRSMVSAQLRALTLEPMLFLAALGVGLEFGSQAATHMLMGKVCRAELGYGDSECDTMLSFDDEAAVEDQEGLAEVLVETNRVRMFQALLALIPGVFYTFLTLGFPRKLASLKSVLVFAMFLNFLAYVMSVVHYAFVDQLPLAFFYTETLASWFGADVLYLFAVRRIAELSDNPRRFLFLSMGGTLFGTIGGPFVHRWLGYYGIFGGRAGLYFVGMVTAIVMLKTHHEEERGADQQQQQQPAAAEDESPVDLGKAWRLLRGGFLSIIGQSTARQTASLFLQVCAFSVLVLSEMQSQTVFLFLFKEFDPFKITTFTGYQTLLQLTGMLGFFMLLPWLKSSRIRFTDATIVYVACFLSGFGQLFSGLATEQWQFMVSQALALLQPWARDVSQRAAEGLVGGEGDERQSLSALLTFLSALMPLFANPMYKMLFEATLDEHAGSFLLLSAGLLCLASIFAAFSLGLGPREFSVREDKEVVRQREIDQLRKDIEQSRARLRRASTRDEEEGGEEAVPQPIVVPPRVEVEVEEAPSKGQEAEVVSEPTSVNPVDV